MANWAHQLIILFAVSALTGKGTALECYHCSSDRNSACGDPIDINKIEVLECRAKEVCYKIVKPSGSELEAPTVERGCSRDNVCHSLLIPCDLCDGNRCNSSSKVLPSFIATAIASLVYCRHFL